MDRLGDRNGRHQCDSHHDGMAIMEIIFSKIDVKRWGG